VREIAVGVISDTHGLMRPEALAVLRGSDLIMHAGDVGKAEVIDALGRLAPTFAVRGNIDTEAWAVGLPTTETVAVGQLRFYLLHELSRLDLDPPAAGFAAVVYGHSHRPSIEMRSGVLYLNPGSAGPRRFKLPVTVARVHVSGQKIRPEIIILAV
jgi:putative phosphoesterase